MTAEEIRAEVKANVLKFNDGGTPTDVLALLLYGMAGEIAAQLAELNEQIGKGRLSPVNLGAKWSERDGMHGGDR
jgi:hypothetical protein